MTNYLYQVKIWDFHGLFNKLELKLPPHPLHDLEMYGSRPDLALRYGTKAVGISMNNPNWDSMFHFYKQKGFKFIKDRDQYINILKINVFLKIQNHV